MTAGLAVTAFAAGVDSIDEARLKADLTFLASPAMEGRLSLRKGSEVAIEWIAAEFAKAGLKPANGGSYLQPVPLIEYTTDREASHLEIVRGGLRKRFAAPDVNIGFPDDVSASGGVVFAGFGVTAPEYNYDDYAGIDAHGKVVLIFDHEPQEGDAASVFKGKGNTRHAGTFVKTRNAQDHGAVAVLLLPEPNRKHPSNEERRARTVGAAQRMRIAPQALGESQLRIPLLTINDKIAAELMEGVSLKALQEQIDSNLKPASRALKASVNLKIVNSERKRGVSQNVIGWIEGSDPALKNETIVFSAHYDHDGHALNGIYAGADDNGSGTVGVIELARAFASSKAKPKRSLLFAVFAAEERGLLGSYHYVAHPLRPLEGTRAVINFDMIGRNEQQSDQTRGLIEIAADTSNEMNLVGANYSPDYRAAVEHANGQVGLRLSYKWDEEAALNVFFRSDQYPFALKGIPAMWWFTGFHPDYHQITDTADRINYAKMAKILRLAYLTALDFAETSKPPKFVP